MTIRQSKKATACTLAVLSLLIAASRAEHFGFVTGLPDAALAVFFLAGAAVGGAAAFAGLSLVCAALDAHALWSGVSSYCVSDAYPFLFVGYGLLYVLGLRAARAGCSMASMLLTLGFGSTAAFAIANASFYALSGHFEAMSAAEYVRRVARYLPAYVLPALAYGAAGLLALITLRKRLADGGDAGDLR